MEGLGFRVKLKVAGLSIRGAEFEIRFELN